MNSLILGIDLGGTKTGVCAGRADGTLLARRRMPTQTGDGPDAWLPRVKALALEVLAEAGATPSDVVRIGISAPGPLNIADRILDAPPNMQGWERVPLLDMIEGALGRPAVMNNDANACALAEYYYGSHKGVGDLVYLTHSTGIGGGILTGGTLVQGVCDYGGEVGHMVLDAGGPPCPCGMRGCFELYCGGKNVADRLRDEIARTGAKTRVLDHAQGDPAAISFECLTAAVREGDALALRYWDEHLERLAQGVGTIIMMVNPRVVLLGTITIHNPDLVLPGLRERLTRYCWKRAREACEIAPSALSGTIGDLSAIAVARHEG